MTKKHYIIMAEIFAASIAANEDARTLSERMIECFRSANDKFDEPRFRIYLTKHLAIKVLEGR
jgi:hypothetical protein